MQKHLDFEKAVADLEDKIEELRSMETDSGSVNIEDEITKLQDKASKELKRLYKRLDPWQKTKVARHFARPHFTDYIAHLVTEWTPLAGDRLYGEDRAIITGIGKWQGQRAAIIGHEKGNTTQARLDHNFGMARPEGYRKAMRIMDLADRFNLPLISLVDTAGAYPGIGAEERGQAEAIARCTDKCLQLRVPFITVVIGEGGSGGALALATANCILMLEHSIYTVASPEAAASILWRTSENAHMAATALKISAQNLLSFGVIDDIIPEPIGGAHRVPQKMIDTVGKVVSKNITALSAMDRDALRTHRRQKFLDMGRKGLA